MLRVNASVKFKSNVNNSFILLKHKTTTKQLRWKGAYTGDGIWCGFLATLKRKFLGSVWRPRRQLKTIQNHQTFKPVSRMFTLELEAVLLIGEVSRQVRNFGMNMLQIKKRLERRLIAVQRYFVVMMEMFVWNFFFVIGYVVFFVHFDRLVNFRFVDLFLLNDGRLVMHMHRLH